jgi:hypothetical protein
MGVAGKTCKGFLVDQVNPKFKEYNRPLTLAILVATISSAVLFGIWTYLMDVGWEERSEIFMWEKTMLDKLVEIATTEGRCIEYVFNGAPSISPEAATMTADWCLPVDFCLSWDSDCDWVDAYCQASSYKQMLANGELKIVDNPKARSDGLGRLTKRKAVWNIDGEWRDYESPCDAQGGDGRGGFGLWTVLESIAPNKWTTLGAALGYMGFIELCVTVPLVYVCLRLGFLQGGPEGHMGEMVKSLLTDIPGGPTAAMEMAAQQI